MLLDLIEPAAARTHQSGIRVGYGWDEDGFENGQNGERFDRGEGHDEYVETFYVAVDER